MECVTYYVSILAFKLILFLYQPTYIFLSGNLVEKKTIFGAIFWRTYFLIIERTKPFVLTSKLGNGYMHAALINTQCVLHRSCNILYCHLRKIATEMLLYNVEIQLNYNRNLTVTQAHKHFRSPTVSLLSKKFSDIIMGIFLHVSLQCFIVF
jgi:hypothetical protein